MPTLRRRRPASIATQIPPHLRGRYRRDPFLRIVTGGYRAINWIDARLRLPALGAGSAGQRAVQVVSKDIAAPDGSVIALVLEPTDGAAVRWSVGAHIDVTLPSGRIRQYSLCGDPADIENYRIAVRRVSTDGGSGEIHDDVTVGTVLQVSVPRNAFPLAIGGFRQQTTHVRLIAGGIGITPIRPMISALESVGVPWSMAYAGRDRDSMAFLDGMRRFGDRVTVLTDDGGPPPAASALVGELPPRSAVYVCGPPPMIDAVRTHLAARPDVELHYERFSPAPVVDGRPFELHFARTDERVPVAADETALTALLRVRPDATYSCRQGFCRSCVVRVVDGVPDHRSTGLSQAERDEGYFLPCVSRADGPLSVDM
ncbi:ferredoxin [Tsukamurella pulmonis]|uniref:Ferredoxin-NADP reductase n=1 Tax=Tsukamurella pulmonis TaxID=47312 RepID=A0A1H1AZA0_9ACTN|nr:PDR/VanB family oxidoreductase [Tsukamurella pulmonis]KXO94217.1 ferredoxin [Tsukamurella pulmonis]SDQ44994.1 Ferredoxin-NADP reductase [Tsukamurella pulmonis]SUP25880.1 Phthalate dioxygenase reductase [Tsukamurella pulmonis]